MYDDDSRYFRNDAIKPCELEIGDFINIHAWHTFGCVVSIEDSPIGSDDARVILLQESPDINKCKRYRLEPGDFDLA